MGQDNAMQDRVAVNRKNAIWGLPFGLAWLVANLYIVVDDSLPHIGDLLHRAAIVKVVPLTPLLITALAVPLVLMAAIIANAIPCKPSLLKKMERLMVAVLAVNVVAILVSLFVIAPLQHYAMPKLGYSRCNVLQGHPNMYFSDWVRDPAWCVPGQTREWVREQAAGAPAGGTRP
jgi:hypothetical protein